MINKIYPILLAGGTGKRLWPLSRKSYPKQFSQLLGHKTLFQQCAIRTTSTEKISFASHLTITNSDFRFIVGEQLQEIGVDPGTIVIEPESKNTAAAILAASVFLYKLDEDAKLLVTPSDHLIPDTESFHEAIFDGLSHIENGKMVTFGIKPTRAETGYGYIELSPDDVNSSGASDVLKFVEKPILSEAKRMLESGNFLWNSGIFLFTAKGIIKSFQKYAPKMLEFVMQAVSLSSKDLDFLRLSPEPWSSIENVSIDYAIMEKADNLVAVPYLSQWSDLGDWEAVWFGSSKDGSGNVVSEATHAVDCSNTLLRSENCQQQLVGLGLQNIIAIAMPDAVLVAHKDRAQDVKKVVDSLIKKNVPQAEIFPKDHRPWGWFESLATGDRFQVKRICVKPAAALSLQSHNHRSEHWIVVKGTAKVTVSEKVQLVTEGQSVYVPQGAIHRIENPDVLPILLIEVQIGSYIGEDDIIRYEDIYARQND